jgi:two-component system OmpR family sensor kinase
VAPAAADPSRRALPLSARLAVTYALLVAATLLVVAALATQLTRSELSSAVDERLAAVVDSFRRGPGAEVTDQAELADRARRWLAVTAFPRDQVVAVRVGQEVLQSTGGLDLQSVEGIEDPLVAQRSRWWDLDGADGPVRALTTPLVLDGSRVGTVVVAASRAEERATLTGLLWGIGWASALGLVFATVVGVLTVRRTLRPLRRMAREVEAIQRTGDLSRRVGGAGPDDEAGRLATAFDAMLARLEEAFASQRRFLSDASHELRTPLQVTRGQLELLEERLRDADGRRSLALATEELERMRRIVDDLLLLARLDEGMPLRREPVEVELVVREALLRGMLLARRRHLVEVEPDLYVEADPDRLLQVVTNLVTNAVRHGGEDATIAIRGRRQGDVVEIAVSDTGPGIPPDELPHVFDRLYRGHASRTGAPAGAGLGLSIAASLSRAMGGGIAVRSEPEQGSTFTIRLPASPRSPAEEATAVVP